MTDLVQLLKANSCELVVEETSHEELKDLEADLPSDTHFVETDQGAFGVRGYKAVDIFDAFHDAGLLVSCIKSGYGRIKPRLWIGS